MNDDTRLCENCPWPLDCCPGQPVVPKDKDCPRDAKVWRESLAEIDFEVAASLPLDKTAEPDEELVLV